MLFQKANLLIMEKLEEKKEGLRGNGYEG